MTTKWYQEGVKAGKTDGWMNLEETLKEDREHRPDLARTPEDLVQQGIDGWEETDHFEILYDSRMMDDAKEESGVDVVDDAVIEKWQDNKSDFWEGYLAGRKSKGIDIYALARRLTAPKKSKKVPKGKSPRGISGTSISSLRR